MAYGTYSEIYIAIPTNNIGLPSFKIGETSNARNRNKQLTKNENYTIIQTYSLPMHLNSKSERLFIESHLRCAYLAYFKHTIRLHRLDYFTCDNKEIQTKATQLFEPLVQFAINQYCLLFGIEDRLNKKAEKKYLKFFKKLLTNRK